MPNKLTKSVVPAVSFDFEINPESIGEGFTQSEMQTMDDCPEKWYLGYNLMLHKQGKFAWPLVYGSSIHSSLEEWYASKGKRYSSNIDIPKKDRQFISQENLAQEEYYRGLADVQTKCYTSHFKGDFALMKPVAIEEVVDIEFEGIRLKGMVDLYAQDLSTKSRNFYVWDHKTTGRIDKTTVLGWDFRFQFMFYCWIASKVTKWQDLPCKGFVINAIKKPQIRQGVNQSLDSFLQRVQSDMMERPEQYYYREKLLLTKDNLTHFEQHILRPKLQRIKLLFDPKVSSEIKNSILRNKNTNHCISKYGSICEFLPACQHGLAIEQHQYRKREHKHQELVSETED